MDVYSTQIISGQKRTPNNVVYVFEYGLKFMHFVPLQSLGRRCEMKEIQSIVLNTRITNIGYGLDLKFLLTMGPNANYDSRKSN